MKFALGGRSLAWILLTQVSDVPRMLLLIQFHSSLNKSRMLLLIVI